LIPFALVSARVLDAQGDAPVDPKLFAGMKYRCVGPSRGGRATTVTGVPQRTGTYYMGTTGGGVWKTTNFGKTWRSVTDGFLTTGSIGAIRVAPSKPDIVYVGTGSDGLRSNVITGRGVWKSTDAGKTWKFIGLRNAGQIGAVEIHPTNPDIVFVAAIGNAFAPNPERGVYRTKDGGKSWRKVLFVSEKIGAVDLELHPADPDVVYASTWRAERKPWTIISGAIACGIHKSIDGGGSWKRLTNGLPTGIVGKSDLTVSRADPDRLFVLIEASGGKGGVYRSDDRGESFRLVSQSKGLLDRPFYYCNIASDPSNADVLYVNSTRFYRSRDAGESWRTVSTPHGDNHDIWIDPDNSKLMIQCNDGGANVSIDGGSNWSTQSNQPTAELYQIAVDDRFPYWLYAGQQDNSTIRVPSLPPYPTPAGAQGYWQSIGGCETGPAIPKPGDADIVYANCKGRFGRFNFRTGQEKQFYVGAANMYGHNPRDLKFRFQRVSPIAVSPHDVSVVYHASQYLHRSVDEGETWKIISPDLTANEPSKQVISGGPITRDITGEEFYSTIYAIAESKVAKGLIWVGANDGPVHVTRDGGKTWKKMSIEGLPPGGRVQTVEPSPHTASKAYVCVLRYQLGDWRPHIYRTTDFGSSWRRITNGIPVDTPTRVVREDPAREGLLYAGTEFGIFVSFNDGANWQPMQLNLPVTPVTDIVVKDGDVVMSTMGRSFWILDDVSRLRQLGRNKQSADLHLFRPAPAYRVRMSRSRGGSGVQYLSTGMFVDYWLAKKARTLTLEVLNSEGKVVRRIQSQRGRRRPREEDAGSGMRPTPRFTPARLSADAGAHRFRFDLRREGPPAQRRRSTRRGGSGSRGSRGPLLVPGKYALRLSVGDISRTATLEIRMDPRVAADGITIADLRAQEQLSLDVMRVTAATRKFAAEVRRKRRGKPANDAELEKIERQLETAKGTYQQPMLVAQLSYLGSMLDRADQRPGKDARIRINELEAWLARLKKEFAALR
jgi:photosystem II stability/assembly factor-like uncharacterized protein